jgi:hypothetical protein
VQTRNGYFDMPEDADFHVGPHELPLLAALRSNPQPADFPFRSRVLRFPGTSSGALVAELALGDLELAKGDGTLYAGRISLLAQLKNADGRLVKKVSEDLPLSGDAAKLDAFRRCTFTLSRSWELPPGRYTLETAVRDHASGRIGPARSVYPASGSDAKPELFLQYLRDGEVVDAIETGIARASTRRQHPLHRDRSGGQLSGRAVSGQRDAQAR